MVGMGASVTSTSILGIRILTVEQFSKISKADIITFPDREIAKVNEEAFATLPIRLSLTSHSTDSIKVSLIPKEKVAS